MNAGKMILYTALGLAAVLLLTSDRAKQVSDDLKDKTMKNAKKWKEKLSKVSHDGVEMANSV